MTIETYAYLGFPFALEVAHPGLRERVAVLFEPCRSDVAPKHTFSVDVTAEGRLGITVDGACGRTTNDPSFALAHLMWEINRRAVCHPSDALVVHGGAVAHDGVAVLCTAPSGHGKSTLVAALLRHGFDYLTDDAIALDLETGVVMAAPKPIALGLDAASMFALVPDSFAGVERFATPQELGADVATCAPVRVVVFPHYVQGAPLESADVSRASALVRVAEQSFNFRLLKERALYGLAEALRESVNVSRSCTEMLAMPHGTLPMSSAHDRPLRAPHVTSVELDGEVVCHADDTLHLLNLSAGIVWGQCDGHSTVEEICARIAAETGHPKADITEDVITLVRDLVDRGLCTLA